MSNQYTRNAQRLNGAGENGYEMSYPGAYYEEEGSSSGSSEEDSSLSDMENGQNVISAYAVPYEDSYRAAPAPRELVAPPHQTSSRQSNKTKQSLNITTMSAGPSGAGTVSSVQHAGNGRMTCLIWTAVTTALVGTALVVVSFLLPLFMVSATDPELESEESLSWLFLWWLIIPGVIFLIVSCVSCCCMCCGYDTNVTTVVTASH